MRREPAVALQLPLASAARGPLALLGSAAGASAAAWVLGWVSLGPFHSAAIGLGPALAAVLGAFIGWRAAGRGSVGLRFDGECWHLCRIAAAADLGQPREAVVDLQVAIDLGSWMLLRCSFDFSADRSDLPGWIALRRSDLEPGWHAFRSAVYSPRSTYRSGVAGNPADP